MISKEQLLYLKHQALNLRIDSIRATTQSKSGHPTSCLSIADIVSTIFFNFLLDDSILFFRDTKSWDYVAILRCAGGSS